MLTSVMAVKSFREVTLPRSRSPSSFWRISRSLLRLLGIRLFRPRGVEKAVFGTKVDTVKWKKTAIVRI